MVVTRKNIKTMYMVPFFCNIYNVPYSYKAVLIQELSDFSISNAHRDLHCSHIKGQHNPIFIVLSYGDLSHWQVTTVGILNKNSTPIPLVSVILIPAECAPY